ncbi:30S ribosomal protein S8 [Patescibacteria group bacterium]|nr:30S ribosomal protein S8 [Patescibacteria group bacterium]MCL5091683.1 30S ribosomal protein S8 [Patescibacteria group bacterium]
MAKRESVSAPYSRVNEAVVKKLAQLQFISDYHVDKEKKLLDIRLRYDDGRPALTDLRLFSTPGRRWYVSYRTLKPVLSGYGFSLLSSPKGIVTNIEAKKLKVGGELLFNIW